MKTDGEKEFTVGDTTHKYVFVQMIPEEATRIAIRLMKIAGLQIGGAIGSLQMKPGGIQEKDFDIDMEILGQSLGKMFTEISEDETIDTFKKMLTSVLYSGKPMTMNHPNFQGHTMHLFNVIMESGRVNFADFFDASSGVVGIIKNVMKSTLNKVTATGPTGGSSSAA